MKPIDAPLNQVYHIPVKKRILSSIGMWPIVVTIVVVQGPAPSRYMSGLFFKDQETFEKAFYDPAFRAGLKEDLERIVNPLFLVSRQLLRS